MLGAVVLEHALQVRHARDQREVAEEDRDPHQLLDHHEDEPVRDRVREEVGQAGGQQEEEADREQQREHDRARPRRRRRCPAASPASSGGICAFAEMPSARKPILSDSRERDHAAHDREPQEPVALRPGDERLGDHLDLALRALLRVGAALGELLGGRLAHRHGPRGDAAHHHALEHGLAADRRVLGGLAVPFGRGAVHGGGGTHRTHRIGGLGRAPQPLAQRRGRDWRRSARARCRPRRSPRSPSRGRPPRARAAGISVRGSRRCGPRADPARARPCPPRRRPR